MKKNFLCALAAGVLALSAAAARAQEEQAGAGGAEAESRPGMPRLFFTNQQRRILEVVRQEYVSKEILDQEEFVPFILTQQEVIDVDEASLTRENNFRVDALVRNRKTGSGVVWLNNTRYELGGKSDSLLQEEGLSKLESDAAGYGSITGTDTYNKSRFLVKVGQSLATDGEVNEIYPVVIVKKN